MDIGIFLLLRVSPHFKVIDEWVALHDFSVGFFVIKLDQLVVLEVLDHAVSHKLFTVNPALATIPVD